MRPPYMPYKEGWIWAVICFVVVFLVWLFK
jgi:hypothetical protein